MEARLRSVEGVAAENRWRIESCERAVEKTAELLSRVEQGVERMHWQQEQSAAAVTKRQAVVAAVLVAVLSPTVSAVLTYVLAVHTR